MSEEKTPEVPEAIAEIPQLKTAFLVAIDANGGVYLERSVDAFRIPVEREATMIEIRRYISEILMDLQAQASAEYTITALSQQAQAAAQANN